MSKITQPHDSYIHYALSQPEVAKGFLKQFLPKKVLQSIDLDTLKMTKETYIEPDLSKVITDVLFKAKINKKPGYIYVLLEQQASPDKFMSFRLVRYTVNIIRDHLEQHKNDKNVMLPAVVPLILFNGTQQYKYSNAFFDLFGPQKQLMEELFINGFPLLDFKTIPDEQLRKNAWSGTMSWALKHVHDRDFLKAIELFVEMFSDLIHDKSASKFIATTLKYGMERGRIEDKERFFNFIETAFTKDVGGEIMSLARQLKDEGRQEGRVEGRQEEKLAIARNLLRQDMGTDLVAQATGLPLDQIEQIQQENFK